MSRNVAAFSCCTKDPLSYFFSILEGHWLQCSQCIGRGDKRICNRSPQTPPFPCVSNRHFLYIYVWLLHSSGLVAPLPHLFESWLRDCFQVCFSTFARMAVCLCMENLQRPFSLDQTFLSQMLREMSDQFDQNLGIILLASVTSHLTSPLDSSFLSPPDFSSQHLCNQPTFV